MLGALAETLSSGSVLMPGVVVAEAGAAEVVVALVRRIRPVQKWLRRQSLKSKKTVEQDGAGQRDNVQRIGGLVH